MALGFAFAVCGKKGRGRTTHLSRVSLREREAGPSPPPPHPTPGLAVAGAVSPFSIYILKLFRFFKSRSRFPGPTPPSTPGRPPSCTTKARRRRGGGPEGCAQRGGAHGAGAGGLAGSTRAQRVGGAGAEGRWRGGGGQSRGCPCEGARHKMAAGGRALRAGGAGR